jgi:hypothetical protein
LFLPTSWKRCIQASTASLLPRDLQDAATRNTSYKKLPAKKVFSTTRYSKSPKKETTVDGVTSSVDNTSIASNANFSCTYKISWSSNKAKGRIKNIVFLEFQLVNLPTTHLRISMFLPGRTKFSISMSAPK